MLITEIQDIDTRNIVRGLVANKTKENSVKVRTINHALRVCPLKDIAQVTRYLIHNEYYDLYFRSIRPTTTAELFWRRSQSISIDKARIIIQAVILENKNDVSGMLHSIRIISDSLLSNKFVQVLDQLRELEAAYGKSRFSLRVISYLMSLRNGLNHEHVEQFPDAQLQEICDDLFDDDAPANFTIFFNHLLDAFDPEISPMDFIIENFNTISNVPQNDPAKKIYFTLFCSALFPNIDIEIDNDSTTADICFSSLIDMVMYCCATHGSDYVQSLCETHANSNAHQIAQSPQAKQQLLDITDERIEQSIQLLQHECLDVSAYRLTSVLYPCDGVRKWKTAIDKQIIFRCQGVSSRIKAADCSDIYPERLKLSHLSKPPKTEKIRLRAFDNACAGVFSRTFAALELIDRGQALTDMKPTELRLLLNQTTSLAELLSVQELRKLKSIGNSGENLVISFLALVMLHDRLGDQDTAFDLRSTFEDVLTQQFHGDFTKFLHWLNQRTPALCHRIAQVCDIDFLERLYHIMDTFDDVIAAREQICRWMGETFDNDTYLQFADRLSLDARIRLIRGEIDDSRIYVDQTRFRQYVTRHLTPLFRKHQRGYVPSGVREKSSTVVHERADKDTIIKANFGGPRHFWLDKACDEAFNVFAWTLFLE